MTSASTDRDASGFDPGRPFRTRDGSTVEDFQVADRGGQFPYRGKVRGIVRRWDRDGSCCRMIEAYEGLNLVNVDPATPDLIPQPEGDAPQATAHSAGAAADGEDDAAFIKAKEQALWALHRWQKTMTTTELCDAIFDAPAVRDALARRGARPHAPSAPSPDKPGDRPSVLSDFNLQVLHEDAGARGQHNVMVACRELMTLRAARGEVADAVLAEREACVSAVAACPTHEGADGLYFRGRVAMQSDAVAAIRARPTPAAVLDRARPAGQDQEAQLHEPTDGPYDDLIEERGALLKSVMERGRGDVDRDIDWARIMEIDHVLCRAKEFPAPPSAALAPPAPASRATSAPAQDAGPAGVTEALVAALADMQAGWRYIRETHADADLYGVGWDRCEASASAALEAAARARTPDAGKETGR